MNAEERRRHSKKFEYHTGSETLVQQHFADEVDINRIVARFGITREMPLGSAQGVYGDFTGIYDYESAKRKVQEAEEGFMKLPAVLREAFANDPGKLIDEVNTLSAEDFAKKYGETTPVVPTDGGVVAGDSSATRVDV